ncbi:hypothetical protein Nepgr_008487 [Nepenthes gracilis]|uniref:Cytochrome P450 n=1 Tax=Nepenthes gracilis TaxID=150966 RepID=A0AAD3S9K5_NEPGR|nr:hypothetical protein Nepgr_008487 [Nepenthes gracilis]
MEYREILLLAAFSFLFLLCFHSKNGRPRNWPFVGMLLSLLANAHRMHDFCTDFLERGRCTFLFRGPWFSNMNILMTVDPSNVHYIMSKNFGNFPKGPDFKEIFDVLGDGIFNADYDLWKTQRRFAHSFITHPRFHNFLIKTISTKVDRGLVPILDHASKQGSVVDLQDLFQRFMFDSICILMMGFDPGCLTIDLPKVAASDALDEAEEALAFRHMMPQSFWKLFRWLGIGKEKQLSRAWKTLDDFMYQVIAAKRGQMEAGISSASIEHGEGADLLTVYIADRESSNLVDDKFLRDTVLNLLIAGRDTTSVALTWLFWLLSQNPGAETKIREEIKKFDQCSWSTEDASSKLVLLHGALCETLRLYPPVPFQHKTVLQPDILPSGHKVGPTMRVMFSLYAMGRMRSIWGDDCLEFKPERWISDRGKIKHEPSYKFLAFNAGPRTCLGKDMAFTQMKVIAASLIGKYRFQAVEGHPVVPDLSVILHAAHGLKVRVLKNFS